MRVEPSWLFEVLGMLLCGGWKTIRQSDTAAGNQGSHRLNRQTARCIKKKAHPSTPLVSELRERPLYPYIVHIYIAVVSREEAQSTDLSRRLL